MAPSHRITSVLHAIDSGTATRVWKSLQKPCPRGTSLTITIQGLLLVHVSPSVLCVSCVMLAPLTLLFVLQLLDSKGEQQF